VVLAAVDSEAVAGDANAPSGRSVLLYAAGTEIWLPVPNVAPTYRLGSVVPVAAQALDD
jgi:hypothetical protein